MKPANSNIYRDNSIKAPSSEKSEKEAVDKPHFHGHRKRMKDKFINADSKSFSDYELIELLLFYSIPRRDVKPLAKDLLSSSGSISGLLNSSMEKLLDVIGLNS